MPTHYDQTNEIEDLRRKIKQMEDEAEDRRNRQEAGRQERQWENEMRASSWEEAWAKGLPRFRSEAIEENRFYGDLKKAGTQPTDLIMLAHGDPYFVPYLIKLEAAKAIFDEEQVAIKETIAHLEAALTWTKQQALNRAADRIEAKQYDPELVEALRKNNPEYLTNW